MNKKASQERTNALRFIILMGIVSLLGDVVYEGARGVTGPYLALLGASATMVGLIGGLGEFIGYALRLFPVSLPTVPKHTGSLPSLVTGCSSPFLFLLLLTVGRWQHCLSFWKESARPFVRPLAIPFSPTPQKKWERIRFWSP